MRNLFDQYDSPENRLTHALVCCLNEDRYLLKQFIQWTTGERPPASRSLEIIEQQLPGEEEPSDDIEERGLPDAWIHDSGSWGIIIESKVGSPLSFDQLRRHRIIAERRGFEKAHLLVITLGAQKRRIKGKVRFITWAELYHWMYKQAATSAWARRMTPYMEIAEAKMISTGYLREGTLTEFSGIHFDNEKYPYNYQEAKRVLGLAMLQLQSNRELKNRLGIDPKGKGRPKITGKRGSSVWDFLPLKIAKNDNQFTSFPHLTLSIHEDRVRAMITLPNGLKTVFRQNLLSLNEQGFADMVMEVRNNLSGYLKGAKGAIPEMYIVQRHFLSQRSSGIEDARLEFDLRTAGRKKPRGPKSKVKAQPQWIKTTYDVLSNKRSNLQCGIGASFPYKVCPELRTPDSTELFVYTWLACKPLLDAMLVKS